MNVKPLVRARAARRDRSLLLAFGCALVAAALLLHANAALAQQPLGAAEEAAARDAARELSPATIRMLQHSLIQGGYGVEAADGVWGPKTAAAVREFQRVKGLEATGRPDARTLEALGVTSDGSARAPGQAAGAQAAPPAQIRARTPAELDRATILAIQRALEQQGLKVGAVDGVWGEQTTTAIANYQRARGMPASGEPDAHTLAALGLLPGGAKPVPEARAGQPLRPSQLAPAAIRLIQQALRDRGHAVGAVDGVWGQRTSTALSEFQRTQGLEPDGEPDAHTLAALGLLPGSERATSPGSASRRP